MLYLDAATIPRVEMDLTIPRVEMDLPSPMNWRHLGLHETMSTF